MAARIKHVRMLNDITQSQLAEAIGTTESVIKNVENNRHGLKIQYALKIVEIFGCLKNGYFMERES